MPKPTKPTKTFWDEVNEQRAAQRAERAKSASLETADGASYWDVRAALLGMATESEDTDPPADPSPAAEADVTDPPNTKE